MNVLSLFDGISCGRVAIERAGFSVEKYYASEIDKYAIQVSKANYPDIIQLGDVTKWKEWNIDWEKIDLLFAGFPCQSWSIAGKQKGDKDPRGQLLWVMLDILNHIKALNPKIKFLFENVRMKKEFFIYINRAIGIEPVMINSALVSAQCRQRMYWVNIEGDDNSDLLKPNRIGQPKDKGILLKDIIESGEQITEKAYSLTVKGQEGLTEQGFNHYLKKKKDNFIIDDSKKHKSIRMGHFNKGGQGDRVYSTDGKSVCLNALGGGGGAKTGLYAIAQRGRNIVDGKRNDIKGAKTEQRFETSYREKSNTLTSVQKDSLLLDGYSIRKLTVIECCRLQTLPDNYCSMVSNSQACKCLGNGWTVDVIAHILKGLK